MPQEPQKNGRKKKARRDPRGRPQSTQRPRPTRDPRGHQGRNQTPDTGLLEKALDIISSFFGGGRESSVAPTTRPTGRHAPPIFPTETAQQMRDKMYPDGPPPPLERPAEPYMTTDHLAQMLKDSHGLSGGVDDQPEYNRPAPGPAAPYRGDGKMSGMARPDIVAAHPELNGSYGDPTPPHPSTYERIEPIRADGIKLPYPPTPQLWGDGPMDAKSDNPAPWLNVAPSPPDFGGDISVKAPPMPLPPRPAPIPQPAAPSFDMPDLGGVLGPQPMPLPPPPPSAQQMLEDYYRKYGQNQAPRRNEYSDMPFMNMQPMQSMYRR